MMIRSSSCGSVRSDGMLDASLSYKGGHSRIKVNIESSMGLAHLGLLVVHEWSRRSPIHGYSVGRCRTIQIECCLI
jgi:hypothetical protein